MKNIHLIPTEKYSDLVHSTNKYGGYFLSKYYSPMKDMGDAYQNIYITSDEEIKDGDYFIALDGSNDIYKANKVWLDIIKENPNPSQKIILTTDQDLIKDGVQAIDDEFLEWFVKNSSCEEVDVFKEKQHIGEEVDESYPKGFFDYKIIIPKEEPKQYNNLNYGGGFTEEDIKRVSERELKQETLEEATERLVPEAGCELNNSEASYWQQGWISGHIDGAKWQAERMYSKEEVIAIVEKSRATGLTAEYLIEQYKNK